MRRPKASTKRNIDSAGFPLVHANAAGMDIGSREHYVAVPEGRATPGVRRFGCTTSELKALAAWLKSCGVDTVAMEATGVYWVPVYEVLEDAGLQPFLFDGRQTRHVSGRKSDVQDCQWSQKLHSFGLLTRAFRPEKEIASLRSYWRQRQGLVESSARQIHLMHKALEQMNVQLHKAVTDVTGVTGMRILRALVAGERDLHVLAGMRHRGVKATEEEVARALEGTYREEHMFALQQALEGYDFFQGQLSACDQAVERQLRKQPSAPHLAVLPLGRRQRRKNQPHFDLRREIARIAGVDVCQIEGIQALTAQTLMSECGIDMSPFPSEKHFASWLGLCPNNRKTGGRIRSRSTRRVKNRAADALRVAAQALHHSNSGLGSYHRHMKARLGAPKAITATAHKLARLYYRLMKYGEPYFAQTQAQYEARRRQRDLQALRRRARHLGFELFDTATGELIDLQPRMHPGHQSVS
jgi:transposase